MLHSYALKNSLLESMSKFINTFQKKIHKISLYDEVLQKKKIYTVYLEKIPPQNFRFQIQKISLNNPPEISIPNSIKFFYYRQFAITPPQKRVIFFRLEGRGLFLRNTVI